MILSRWIREKGNMTYKEFSRQTGIDYNKLQTYIMGIRSPRYETAQIIIKATNGEVTLDDLMRKEKPTEKI